MHRSRCRIPGFILSAAPATAEFREAHSDILNLMRPLRRSLSPGQPLNDNDVDSINQSDSSDSSADPIVPLSDSDDETLPGDRFYVNDQDEIDNIDHIDPSSIDLVHEAKPASDPPSPIHDHASEPDVAPLSPIDDGDEPRDDSPIRHSPQSQSLPPWESSRYVSSPDVDPEWQYDFNVGPLHRDHERLADEDPIKDQPTIRKWVREGWSGNPGPPKGSRPRQRASPAHLVLPIAALFTALIAAGLLVPELRPRVICAFFTVVKPTGALRLIFNGVPLNRCFPKPPKFKMASLHDLMAMALRFRWCAKLDIKHFYLHHRIHPKLRPYFCLQWMDKVYAWTSLPFGFSHSGYICHRIVKQVLKAARKKGIQVTFYCDDIHVWADDYDTCLRHQHEVVSLLRRFYRLNDSKQELPSQRPILIGYEFDLIQKTLDLPAKWKRGAISLLRQYCRDAGSHTFTRRDHAIILGTIIHASRTYFGSMCLLNHLIRLVAPEGSWRQVRPHCPMALEEVRYFAYLLEKAPPRSMHIFDIQGAILAHTDASTTHGGIMFPDGDVWSYFDSLPDFIFDKESRAASILLMRARRLCIPNLLLALDNQPLFYALKKGRSRNRAANFACFQAFLYRNSGGSLHLRWLPTEENPADLPSRPNHKHLEHARCPREAITRACAFFQCGPPSIDAFATQESSHTLRFIGPGSPIAIDAFTVDLRAEKLVYAFPPFHRLHDFLTKIRLEGFPCLLISPDWHHAFRPMMDNESCGSFALGAPVGESRYVQR